MGHTKIGEKIFDFFYASKPMKYITLFSTMILLFLSILSPLIMGINLIPWMWRDLNQTILEKIYMVQSIYIQELFMMLWMILLIVVSVGIFFGVILSVGILTVSVTEAIDEIWSELKE